MSVETTKADQLRAMREAKSSRGGGESRPAAKIRPSRLTIGNSVEAVESNINGSVRTAIAGVAPGPRDPQPSKYDCPVCAARRMAKRASQAKFRRKQAEKRKP